MIQPSALTLCAISALVAGAALSGCTAKEPAAGQDSRTEITVDASDTDCVLSAAKATTGPSTFVVTNTGSKVTEFYVYGSGDRVLGEVENVSPGLQRTLVVNFNEPGTYQTACKPGMVGDGIRKEFVVTGAAVAAGSDGKSAEAAATYKRYIIGQTEALAPAAEAFAAATTSGDIANATALYPTTRTFYERIEPVAESFPNDLDPRIDLREADLEPGQKWAGFHRLGESLGKKKR